MATLWLDLRFGFRLLLKNATFALVAALTLALGIGANTAIFSVVNAVLLKPLPYPQPDRLAMVWLDNRRLGLKEDLTSYPNFGDWKKAGASFADMAPFTESSATLTGVDEPERLRGALVPAGFFGIIGVAPQAGRQFSEQEEQPGSDRAVILSDGLWKRKFGGSRDAIGKSLELDGRPMTIVGVMPPEFRFPSKDTELWAPLALSPQAKAARGSFWASVVGRLKPGARIEQAQAELDSAARRIEQEFPNMRGYGANVVPLQKQIVGNVRMALLVLAGAVAFVLLIACTNVAGLFLARVEAREREIAVRAALGAGRRRLIRQLLTESMVLAMGAGVIGLGFAVWATDALVGLAPRDLPRLAEIGISSNVLWFTLGVTLLTGVLFGLAPAVRISRGELIESLREGGRSLAGGVRARRMRAALVVAEFAMAVVLLAGAGLMIRSLAFLRGVDPGFRPDRLLTMRISVSSSKTPERAQIAAFYQQLIERIRALPGVREAGGIRDIFLSRTPSSAGFTIEGRAPEPEEHRIEATIDPVTPGYFTAMGVPLTRGRFFTGQDGPASPPVAIINETMARRFWPNEDPIGKRFTFGDPRPDSSWLRIVGVVADMRRQGLDSLARCETFEPLSQRPSRGMNLVIRTAGDPLKLAQGVRAEVRAMDRDTPVINVTTIERLLGESMAERCFQMTLLGLFSTVALALAAIGIYCLMYHSVARRTHEIGVRIALGASARDVLALVVREGLLLAAVGVAAGLAGSFALTRALAGLLFGVTATDPVTFAGVAGMLLMVALAASLIPARRATRVDPMVALRYE
jgi:putative ABC transport system permease protein